MSLEPASQKEPKPDTATAMRRLIEQIRAALPFDLPQSQLCAGPCNGCPKKLLEYLDCLLEEWEQRLRHDHQPRLGDLSKLSRTARKIHQVLVRNQLIEDA